jgi:lysophospholipase L1-like esterase
VLGLCCLLLNSCSSSSNTVTTGPPAPASIWVASWGAPPENASATAEDPGGSEQSFRFVVLPTIDGTEERVHFSNAYGTAPVTIGSARIAVAGTGAAVDASTDKPLTFSGGTSVTIAAGQQIVSDPVNVSYTFGQKLAVSMYVKGTFAPLTQHDSQVSTNYASAVGSGDTTTDATGAAFANSNTEWYLLSGIDVYGPYQGTVVLLGSSSIDGHGSNYGSANAYPVPNVPVAGQDNDRPSDWLARSLVSGGYRVGVYNAGILADSAEEFPNEASGTATPGVDRVSRDVLQIAGVKAVVIYLGGVDLRGQCVPATNVEAALTNIVAQANAGGIRVILATIPPAEYCVTSDPSLLPSAANPWQGDVNPGPENPGSTQRRLVNTWIKTAGSQLPGVVSVADFDAALAYPGHPDFLMPNFTSADNFHPTGLGYQAQSGAIDLKAILGQ